MNQNNTIFRGVIPPIITPLRAGKPDLLALRSLLDRTLHAGCDALCIGGTVGLGPMLTDADWLLVMQTASQWADHRIPLLAGVMETSTPRAIERIRLLEQLDFSGYLLTPTYYVTPRSPAEYHRHFAKCHDSSSMAMLLYNAPPCTACAIPNQIVEQCCREGLTRGIKDSSGDLNCFVEYCRIMNHFGGSAMMGGRPDLAWMKRVGGGGIVPVPANLAPEPFVAGWNAMQRGDENEIARQQTRIDQLWKLLVSPDDWMRGTIYALHKQGIGDDDIITPLDTLLASRRAAIDAWLNQPAR